MSDDRHDPATEDDERALRERVTRLAFDGDVARFEEFVRLLAEWYLRVHKSS